MRGDLSAETSSDITQKQSNEGWSIPEIARNFYEFPNYLKKSFEESHDEASVHMGQIEEDKEGSSDPSSMTGTSEDTYISLQEPVKERTRCWDTNPWKLKASKAKFDAICSSAGNNQSTQLIKPPNQNESVPSNTTCQKADGKSRKVNPFGVYVDADCTRLKESVSESSFDIPDQDELKEENSVNPFTKKYESTISSNKFRPSRAGMYYSTIWEKSKCIMKELNVQQKYVDIQRNAYPDFGGNVEEEIYIESPHGFELCRDTGCVNYKNCFLRFPYGNKIMTLSEKLKDLCIFLSQTFPRRVKSCDIYFPESECAPPNHILPQILKINSAVEKEISFSVYRFNERHFKRSLAAFRHIENIEFNSCTLLVPRVPDLSLALKGSKIKELKFCHSVVSSSDDEFTNPGELENLIKGFTTSPDLMQSLQQLKFQDWEIEEELPENFEESFTKKFENSFGKRIEITFPRY
ncbi:unnamed protein product [Moneuplotes crassus]|uniref:Uncharacterized protein n=1 Tax=Euplotes crassus TaxID=5936 RepID=A0AAD1TZB9_EUPCR|nr:unnamed protein product [Moneuplotes crassus]